MREKTSYDAIVEKMKEFVQKLYLVVFSKEFKYDDVNPVSTAIGNSELMTKRVKLIESSLRFGMLGTKKRYA